MAGTASKSQESRFDKDGDWLARKFFSQADLRISPEEYAARNAHRWVIFSLHRYRYHDPVLGAWVRRVGEILSTEGDVDRCRREILKPGELAEVLGQAAQAF